MYIVCYHTHKKDGRRAYIEWLGRATQDAGVEPGGWEVGEKRDCSIIQSICAFGILLHGHVSPTGEGKSALD